MSVMASRPAASIPVPDESRQAAPRFSIVVASVFILLFQAGCAIIVFFNRISLVLGATTLLTAHASRLHSEPVRLPLLALASAGSVFNLFLLWNARRLRNKPEAQWRIRPLRFRDKLRNGIVFSASVLTLFMVISELLLHPSVYPGWRH